MQDLFQFWQLWPRKPREHHYMLLALAGFQVLVSTATGLGGQAWEEPIVFLHHR